MTRPGVNDEDDLPPVRRSLAYALRLAYRAQPRLRIVSFAPDHGVVAARRLRSRSG